MKSNFSKFNKNKKQKRIIIGAIVGILFVIGGITLYRSYALFKVEKEFNVLKGVVPEFTKSDLELAVTLDGNQVSSVPEKGSYDVVITCNNGATGSWDYDEWGPNIRNVSAPKTKCSLVFTTKQIKVLAEFVKEKSKTDETIVEIVHEETEQTPALTDYRYVGADPNNYIYFGCDTNCTNENLYRIIGVIPTQSSDTGEYENRVKLIKATNWEGKTIESSDFTESGKGYRWNTVSNNKWEESPLKNVLNGEYWNSLENYQKYVEPAKWYLGATPGYNSGILTQISSYKNERSNTQNYDKGSLNYIANVGLMYLSDYGYSIIGSEKKELSFSLEYNNYVTNAWLYTLKEKYLEWTIMSSVNTSGYAWYIKADGNISTYPVSFSNIMLGVRPTFYLKSNVEFVSGTGEKNDPYRLA